MVEWAAERLVDEEQAADLIAEQFAPLPERSVRAISEGWDYAVFVVDERWAFRFPRRAVVVPGTEREIAVLGTLAPLLPVAVPAPAFVGRPTASYPWPFFGAPFLPGLEAGEARLSDDERVALARPLARALRTLHAPATLATLGASLPADPMGRGDPAVRMPRARERVAALRELGLREPPAALDELFERALELPPPEPSAVCHGDLHFRQLLVDGGALSGIIDWVDVCRADPGIDLQLVWSFLPPAGRDAFLDEYGPVDEASLLRARVLAVDLNAVLARYGREECLPAVEDEALAGLDRAAAS